MYHFLTLSVLQVEYFLYQLLCRYAALCGILGEHHESILHQGHFAEACEGDLDTAEAITSPLICGCHMQAYFPRQELCNEENQLDYSVFDLYKEHVFCFDNNGEFLEKLTTLSDTFCETFSNLEMLELSNLWKITELPNNISRCQNLVFLKLSSMSITSLPRDLLLLPCLRQLECTDMRVTSLDFNWPTQSLISHLNLSDLLLTSVPDELCLLSELTHLNISHNPLTSLPSNFVYLKKLRYLYISGNL